MTIPASSVNAFLTPDMLCYAMGVCLYVYMSLNCPVYIAARITVFSISKPATKMLKSVDHTNQRSSEVSSPGNCATA